MKTKVIKLSKLTDITSAIDQAQKVLDQGGLVGFPTETVYGLAAKVASGSSLERLRRIKQRSADKPFTLHIARHEDLDRFVPDLTLLDRHFLRKAWPGPLTVIFELNGSQLELIQNNLPPFMVEALYHNNSIGIRLPDHPVARQLLAAVNGPVVAPSANLAHADSPTRAEDVLAQLGGEFELLLDSGPTRYGKSSTIIKLIADEMKIIRPGILDKGALERMRKLTILFVCTGNTCRSPIAEGFCRKLLAEKLDCAIDELPNKRYKVTSAGMMAFAGLQAAPDAVQACREANIDISTHRSRKLTLDMVNKADFILVMDNSHYRAVLNLSPQAEQKTQLLAGVREVADPIGMPLDTYRNCAREIAQGIRNRLKMDFKVENLK